MASLAAASAYYGSDQHSPVKYPENGHDTLSDFVTFVCQEAESTQGAQVSLNVSTTILVFLFRFGFVHSPFPLNPAELILCFQFFFLVCERTP